VSLHESVCARVSLWLYSNDKNKDYFHVYVFISPVKNSSSKNITKTHAYVKVRENHKINTI